MNAAATRLPVRTSLEFMFVFLLCGSNYERRYTAGANLVTAASMSSQMSIVQRDYLEQMIEEAAGALGQILQLARVGDLDLALILVGKTRDLVLGPMRPVLERVDAASAVGLVGKYDLDRLRMYAALLGEEGAIHERRGKPPPAHQCYRHAL